MISLDDPACLRRGDVEDLQAVLAVKRALPMPRRQHTRDGGFLLGCDPKGYHQLLLLGRVWILEVNREVVGFSVTFSDDLLRASPLWARRTEINWKASFDPACWLSQRIGFFDQLAVLPRLRFRYWGAALALRALLELFDEQHHALVLTTTVIEPIVNAAVLPFLARVGAQEVGTVAESHPELGSFTSAVHAVQAKHCRDRIAADALSRKPAALSVVAMAQFA